MHRELLLVGVALLAEARLHRRLLELELFGVALLLLRAELGEHALRRLARAARRVALARDLDLVRVALVLQLLRLRSELLGRPIELVLEPRL